jgi:hypothetical protein
MAEDLLNKWLSLLNRDCVEELPKYAPPIPCSIEALCSEFALKVGTPAGVMFATLLAALGPSTSSRKIQIRSQSGSFRQTLRIWIWVWQRSGTGKSGPLRLLKDTIIRDGYPTFYNGTMQGLFSTLTSKGKVALVYDEAESFIQHVIEAKTTEGSLAAVLNTLDDGGEFHRTLVSRQTCVERTHISMFIAGQPGVITNATGSRQNAIRQADTVSFAFRFLHIFPDAVWRRNRNQPEDQEIRDEFKQLLGKLKSVVDLCDSDIVIAGEASRILEDYENAHEAIHNSEARFRPDLQVPLIYLSKCVGLVKIMAAALHLLSFLGIRAEKSCDPSSIRTLVDAETMHSAIAWVEHGLSCWHTFNAVRNTVVKRSPDRVNIANLPLKVRPLSYFEMLEQATSLEEKVFICVSHVEPLQRELSVRTVQQKLKSHLYTAADIFEVFKSMSNKQPDLYNIPAFPSTGNLKKCLERLYIPATSVSPGEDSTQEVSGNSHSGGREQTAIGTARRSSKLLDLFVEPTPDSAAENHDRSPLLVETPARSRSDTVPSSGGTLSASPLPLP